MLASLREIEHVTCAEPMGAFYTFPNLSAYIGHTGPEGIIQDDIQLATYLLQHHDIAIVPGSAFGAPGFSRLSYAVSDEDITKGISRMATGLKELQG